MRNKLNALLLTVLVTGQVQAQFEELIFQSSFETGEDCVTFSSLNYNILVPVVHITGNFTLNGNNFPQTQYDDAVFSLRDRYTGDVFELGNSHDLSYSANVVAGQYDVMYSVQDAGANVPRNIGAMVMENVVLLSDQTLDIDLTSYQLSGSFFLNSVPFPVITTFSGSWKTWVVRCHLIRVRGSVAMSVWRPASSTSI